jgi:hypothetical protein
MVSILLDNVYQSYVTFTVYWIEKIDMICTNYLQFKDVCEAK